MALSDFIQSLQDDDIVYSEAPAPSIQVIPPETSLEKEENKRLQVNIPELKEDLEPKKIKLKLNKPEPKLTVSDEDNNKQIDNPVKEKTQKEESIQLEKPQLKQDIQKEKQEEDLTEWKMEDKPLEKPDRNKSIRTQNFIPEEEPIKEESKEQLSMEEIQRNKINELFNKSGTEISKKDKWLECYEKAQRSKKHNQVAEKMKIGRFTITPDDKVLILADYDTVNKDPDDIIKDTWL